MYYRRDDVALVLSQNPGLHQKLPEVILCAYRKARRKVAAETGHAFESFPAECPWTFEQIMDDGFWPE
ncbi:MAG: DUF29 family protein [Nitrospiraceae bacterium]